ncbi:MAG: hypothetical protein RM022_015380 [Nostoc sp. EfeVER01]|uniref:hypothetical protein n=1 Tax=unclassified Nostoc TaxID=2593658 RepID=UPI002AD359B6|nr:MULTISPECIES: hypothetical protein [unclassified Nostoc]MDZ7947107.1 hypothetical protein [Nostoc sp. EfeVER01]MDZ7993856.1 hypothetical protein [Nostoc sp. EspVER01]
MYKHQAILTRRVRRHRSQCDRLRERHLSVPALLDQPTVKTAIATTPKICIPHKSKPPPKNNPAFLLRVTSA